MKKPSLTDLGKTRMSKDICACMATRKAARSITQFYSWFLSDSSVGASQHSILMIAYLAQAITITKMADIAVMDRTTLTRNIRPLVKEGLIEINPGEDRREKVITITRKGIKLLKKITPMWEKAQIEFEKRFGSKKFDNLINNLNEVVSITQ
jgi:DNA-binding MarR family transcriptional regulator